MSDPGQAVADSVGRASAERRKDWAALVALLVLATSVRAWVVCHTAVPARDAVGFIHIALALERQGWGEAVRGYHQHPGYPASVLVVSWPVRALWGTDCDSLQLAAQVASALAGALLVVPMFLLGRRLFDRSAGFWGALLFQCLPASGHILSDALSDPLFLLLSSTALVLSVRAADRGGPEWFALAGLCAGLAYLVRPEGVLAAAALGCALLGFQFVPAWRRPWRQAAACAAALTLATLAAGSPYYLAAGRFTNKPSAYQLTHACFATPAAGPAAPSGAITAGVPPASEQAGGSAHGGTGEQGVPSGRQKGLGLKVLVGKFVRCHQYVGWLPTLLGLWWWRSGFLRLPGFWVVLTLFTLHAAVLWRLVTVVGYLSDRHVLLLVLCTAPQAAAAVRALPSRLAAWLPGRHLRTPEAVGAWAVLLLLLWVGAGLTRTLKPLHASHVGFRAAGRWLAEHARPGDAIEDDHQWARYYAGGTLTPHGAAASVGRTRYVVVGRPASRAAAGPEGIRASESARVVFRFPPASPREQAAVVVYAHPLP
jgi:hypothetical protein